MASCIPSGNHQAEEQGKVALKIYRAEGKATGLAKPAGPEVVAPVAAVGEVVEEQVDQLLGGGRLVMEVASG